MNRPDNQNPDQRDAEIHNQLDQMLQTWSDEVVLCEITSRSNVTRLQENIAQNLVEPPDQFSHTSTTSRKSGSCSEPREVGMALAIAACLLLGLSIAIVIYSTSFGSRSPVIPEFASILQNEFDNQSQLAQQCVNLFGSGFQGAIQQDDRLEMQIDETGDVVQNTNLTALVRLACAKRVGRNGAWQPVWTRDFIAVNENLMQSAGTDATDSEIELWTYRLPDGNVLTDVSIQGSVMGPSKNRIDLSCSKRTLLESNISRSIHCVVQGQTEYCVFQSVALFDKDGQGGTP